MRKVVGAAVGGVVLLVGGSVGAAAWSGRVVTGELSAQTEALSKLLPTARVLDERIDHGVFRSTRTLTLELGCVPSALSAPDDPAAAQPRGPTRLQVGIRDVVHHGPFPEGRRFGAATVETDVTLPEAFRAAAEPLIGKQPLVHLKTDVDFGGAFASTFTLPGVRLGNPGQDGSLDVRPTVGTVRGQPGGSYTVDLPSVALSVRGDDGTAMSFKLADVHSDTTLAARPDPAIWLGAAQARGTARAIALTVEPGQGALPVDPIKVSFGNIQFSSDATLDKGLWSTTARYSGSGKVNDVPLDKLEFATSMKRIHAETYQRVLTELLRKLLSCDPNGGFDPAVGIPEKLQADLLSLLLHDPEYGLDKLAVTLRGKRAELAYHIGTRGVTRDDLNGPPSPEALLEKLALSGSAALDLGLVAELMAKVGAADPDAAVAGGGTGEPSSAAQSMMMLDMMVEQGVEQGFVTREGDLVKTEVTFERGQLLVNGKGLALPDLPSIAK